MLVTSHRRESWAPIRKTLCLALKDLVNRHPDIRVIYPVHMNPNVRSTIHALLDGIDRIHLTEPLDYLTFCQLAAPLLHGAYGFWRNSRGAPTFTSPCSCSAKLTERPEASAIWNGQDNRHVTRGNL